MLSSPQKPSILPARITFPGVSLPPVLPTSNGALKALLLTQQQAYEASVKSFECQVHDYLNHLVEQFILARHRQFGSSSEQISGQARLFDEAEVLATGSTEAQDIAPPRRLPHQTRASQLPRHAASGRLCRPSCLASRSCTTCPKRTAPVAAAHRWW